MKTMPNAPDMREAYDFSRGVRGKYAKRHEEGTNVVVLGPDVAQCVPDHDAGNEALRHHVALVRQQKTDVAKD